mmetsp:Transcript_98012/g.211287  ORF Transcript_98012/g.211287 Transcript_98012/m.211287 type:complete len:278 (-) Transcript_98012:1742-2575(-)
MEVVLQVQQDGLQRRAELAHGRVQVARDQRLDPGPREGTLHDALDGELGAPLVRLARREAVYAAARLGHLAGVRGARGGLAGLERREVQVPRPRHEERARGLRRRAREGRRLHGDAREGGRRAGDAGHERVAAVEHHGDLAGLRQHGERQRDLAQRHEAVGGVGLAGRGRLGGAGGPQAVEREDLGRQPIGEVDRHQVPLLVRADAALGAIAAEEEEELVVGLRVGREPLQALQDVRPGRRAVGDAATLRAVHDEADLVLRVLQRVAEQAQHVPGVV